MWRLHAFRRPPLRPHPPDLLSSLFTLLLLLMLLLAPIRARDDAVSDERARRTEDETEKYLINVSSTSLESPRKGVERRVKMTSSVGTLEMRGRGGKRKIGGSPQSVRKGASTTPFNATVCRTTSQRDRIRARPGCRGGATRDHSKTQSSRRPSKEASVDSHNRCGWSRKDGSKKRGHDRRGRGNRAGGRNQESWGGERRRKRGRRKGWRAEGGRRGGGSLWKSEGRPRQQFFVAVSSRRRILLKGSSRYTNSRLYGRWSRWSPCSRSCTTQRFRWCKRPLQCGSDVVREEAYCYVEGSFCHRWIHRRIHQQPDTDDNEADIDPLSDDSDPQPSYGVNPTQSQLDLWSQKDCGVPLTNRTSYLSFRRHQQALRIIGGRESVPGRWPWQVAVLNRFKEAFCGGTLVAPQWVLTAAHCIRKRLYVRLGEHDLAEEDGTETEFRVEEAVVHPEYDADTVDNDVALLRLPSWATSSRHVAGLGNQRPLACLPRPRQALPWRRLCTIIGWGKRKSSDAFGTDVLHEAEVPIVSNEICRDVYEDYYITGNMFCAGYHKGRMDSCAGDSGGPLLCLSGRGADGTNPKWTIFGITSFGEGCGKRGKYGIYTKVSNYVRWVQRVVKGYSGNGKY